jgi:hypothetical protein
MKRRQPIEERIALVRVLQSTLRGVVPALSSDGAEVLACFLVGMMSRTNEATDRLASGVSTNARGVS